MSESPNRYSMSIKSPQRVPRHIWCYFTASIVAVGVLLGCRAKEKEAAIGNWQASSGKERIEFQSDGTLRGVDEYGRPLSGSFTRIDRQRIRMELSVRTTNAAGDIGIDSSSGVCRVIASADSLTLVEPDGTRKEYRKAK